MASRRRSRTATLTALFYPAFTFFIALFWGYRFFRPELFTSTEPFLVAHFLLYQAIAVLYALRRPPDRPDLVDGTIVFGTPVMAFGLQSAMLYDTEYGLAAYAFTSNLARAWRVAEALEAGTVGINDGVPSTSICPFGGFKESGWGRELGLDWVEAGPMVRSSYHAREQSEALGGS